jgi:hypothetical protein
LIKQTRMLHQPKTYQNCIYQHIFTTNSEM